MKTITFILAIAMISVSAMANNKKYNTATALLSEKKVTAVAAERKVTTYFDTEGNVLATCRSISEIELPQYAVNKLIKKCPDEQIKLIREFDALGEKTYIVTLENATGFKVVKVTSSELEILEQLKKN
ncbi:hypothetical protein [Chitinophaga barathri]|uniref:Beta-lactamase-inhibitor-like PepSY-like domain-containing protein n=1 Tax=Chitinophaga barathri TaxID=1647451 RepID=A0A3N4MBY3_9BACT|nr:hypothetical protein [Chitinophaga barathri]RPD41161.1 hypothetical protein EG028_10780 [Chitinophaga barathri]